MPAAVADPGYPYAWSPYPTGSPAIDGSDPFAGDWPCPTPTDQSADIPWAWPCGGPYTDPGSILGVP